MSERSANEAPRKSAGGVVACLGDILLVWKQGGKREGWTLPKGGSKRGETPPETAAREILEESRLIVEIGAHLGTVIRPSIHPGYENVIKRVEVYATHWDGGIDDSRLPDEVCGWVGFDEAVVDGIMRYTEERDLLVAHREIILATGVR